MSEISIEEGGFLIVNKPLRWTSFDVVTKLRNVAQIKKIGHAGTLDPLATGVLIVCYGKYTKKIEEIQAMGKVYTGTFCLGKTTPSFDLETEVDGTYSIAHITPAFLEDKVNLFRGDIKQVPPQYSAVKIKGKRAYEHARAGESVVLKMRDAHISKYEVDMANFPEISFEIHCSKGTYIRALARDLGVALESGAFMSSLVRTRIGDFSLVSAVDIENIKDSEYFFKIAQQF